MMNSHTSIIHPHMTAFQRSVTIIRLENGDNAVYVYGECLACADYASGDPSVTGTGIRLAEILESPLWQLTLPVPDDEAWCWNDIVAVLVQGGYTEVTA